MIYTSEEDNKYLTHEWVSDADNQWFIYLSVKCTLLYFT